MLELLLKLSPEEARNLLYLIHNTESMVRSIEDLTSGKSDGYLQTETFASVQSGVLENISSVVESLESLFGKSEYKKRQQWSVKIDSKS